MVQAIETQDKGVSLLPPEESALRTELEANLAKYRQAAEAESTDQERAVPTDASDDNDSKPPGDSPGSGI